MTYNALGVFIYAGGFTEGVKRHFDVPAHFEDGNFGVATTKLNHDLEVFEEPLAWPVSEYRNKIDFVHSNPPCAPWSNAGKVIDGKRGAAYAGDIRLACVEQSFDVFMETRAHVWAWESVARTPYLARAYIDALAKRAAKRGHECTVIRLNAVQCGAPQLRDRAFVIMHDVELDLTLAPVKPRTVRMALASHPRTDPRPNVSPKTEKWLRHVPQGAKLNEEFDRLHKTTGQKNVSGRPGFLQRRLAWDRPSFTITGGCHLYHPNEDRYISSYESAALCGFSKSYEFTGGTSAQYAQVGKGVMPPVGDWLGKKVRAALEENVSVKKPGTVRVIEMHREVNVPRLALVV